MTPAEVILSAQTRYNAVNDNFYPYSALVTYLQDAERDLSSDVLCIEATDSTIVSVVDEDTYDFPSLFLDVRSVRYDGGKPLEKLSQKQIEELYPQDGTVQTGTPRCYTTFDDQIILWPVPDTASDVVTVTGHKLSDALAVASTVLTVPTRLHHGLYLYVLSAMFTQDQNGDMSRLYDDKWEKFKVKARRREARRKRADRPGQVNMAQGTGFHT